MHKGNNSSRKVGIMTVAEITCCQMEILLLGHREVELLYPSQSYIKY